MNPLLSPSQSSFRRGDSTSWQLLRLLQALHQTKDTQQFSLLCFFDLSQAFDSVWTRGLLCKLRAFGLSGNVYNWLTSYLIGRSQCVRVRGHLSRPATVESGVPQGSIVGPLLFAIYVNDLASLPHTYLYADITAPHVSSSSLSAASVTLQTHIDKVVNWMTLWKLKPNASKPLFSAFLFIPIVTCLF